ncbi:MAG: NUDIX domain-containing protein [Candidatus Roizmanbacteria bacterium]|nr:NUDIX domain-containing protein [Candidatus Roizmanbacteria bacterium]
MDIETILTKFFSHSHQYPAFLNRAQKGDVTRDENPVSHFCTYMGIFDPMTKEVFMGHHKKADKWLFNGGHIDKGELPLQAALRELYEEVGLQLTNDDLIGPSLINHITIPPSTKFTCREHYHIWYFVPVRKNQINTDHPELKKEFYTNKWLTIREARVTTTDETNLEALRFLTHII